MFPRDRARGRVARNPVHELMSLIVNRTELRSSPVPISLLWQDEFDAWRSRQSEVTRRWLEACMFKPERHRLGLLPGLDGQIAQVLLGLGERAPRGALTIWHVAGLAERLPAGDYQVEYRPGTVTESEQLALGWLYGQYRFGRYRSPPPERRVRLVTPEGVDPAQVERTCGALGRARDLINTPAGDLPPEALCEAIRDVAAQFGARCTELVGDALLAQGYPAVHTVGRASSSPPRVIDMSWGEPDAPRVTLIGKGVCFDSGGLDIKQAQGMLLMKKDMGGAACALALAELVMGAGLPVRLRLIVPAVENSIAGNAYRPGDIIRSRRGITVEVGNTDAEGRLILCDALAAADEEQPELLVDLATLTGAARIALGPELPALFSSDDDLARQLVGVGRKESDPLWHMPLWDGYEEDLASRIADLSNVSGSTFAGAVMGALFLRRFVERASGWLHVDLFGWNPRERPGRPVGGEPQSVRALFSLLRQRYAR